MIEFQTASGSTYLVDQKHLLIKRVVRSVESASQRVAPEWKSFVALGSSLAIGKPLIIVWGYGRDEHSETVECVGNGPDECRTRMTLTSPVISFRHVELDA